VCKYFGLCVYFCVNIFVKKKKKNLPYTVRSTIPCMFDRIHGPTFELVFVRA
jgi:hypothetical protein